MTKDTQLNHVVHLANASQWQVVLEKGHVFVNILDKTSKNSEYKMNHQYFFQGLSILSNLLTLRSALVHRWPKI